MSSSSYFCYPELLQGATDSSTNYDADHRTTSESPQFFGSAVHQLPSRTRDPAVAGGNIPPILSLPTHPAYDSSKGTSAVVPLGYNSYPFDFLAINTNLDVLASSNDRFQSLDKCSADMHSTVAPSPAQVALELAWSKPSAQADVRLLPTCDGPSCRTVRRRCRDAAAAGGTSYLIQKVNAVRSLLADIEPTSPTGCELNSLQQPGLTFCMQICCLTGCLI